MKYDAFISYRHGELDGLVAEKLHKMLETYRIPRAIAKKIGKKRLSRVFRDREELPTSSNLSDSINDALVNSSFLLLICSKRTCQSQWVMREVEQFGELHGKDRIIALLVDGEPDESFPPGLRERQVNGETIFVEPLAADIRAETWAKSIKLLKEEKLRLLAPILGCAFDDLRRRHRRRKIQRVVSVVSSAFVFSVSFGVFSTWQYIQINRQMQLKLENQSYVLAEYSAGELAAGNPDRALLLALAALPEDLSNPERPLVPAAQRALSDAVGIYDVYGGFKPHKVISLPVSPGKVLLSPDEKHAAVIYPFELALIDTDNASTAALLPTIQSVLADVEFISDSAVVFSGENGIEAYDFVRGERLWQGQHATAIAVSDDRTVIAAVFSDEGFAVIYSADGKKLSEISFYGKTMCIPVEGSFLNPHDTLFELSGDGSKLAVSFSDGSLSVYDTGTSQEISLYPSGNAIHFAGGFWENTLAFSVVENEPYYSGYFVYNLQTGKKIAQYESDTSRFFPFVGKDGIYVAFEDQIMAVDTITGAVSHVESAGDRVEVFDKSEDTLLVSETGGDYYFSGNNKQVYWSDYICHFVDIGSNFALTGSYDSKDVRILRKEDGKGDRLISYDESYRFTDAKVNSALNRAVFYSYSGMRLYDLTGNVITEVEFPNPMDVLDTRYDEHSGNLAVVYKSAFRLYSGVDGSLLSEQQGKAGIHSVIYTDFGISVLSDSGDATLYSLSTGQIVQSLSAGISADSALSIGDKLLVVEKGKVYLNGDEIGEGKLIGAAKIGENNFVFAVSDGADGIVFALNDNILSERFPFQVFGEAEAYFCGDYVFISPSHGDATVYNMKGKAVRLFEENGFLAETKILGDYIAADYVSSSSERYTFLLEYDTLETVAYLPGFLGEYDSSVLVFDDGDGHLRSVKLYNSAELKSMAQEQLNGRVLSSEEIKRFKVG